MSQVLNLRGTKTELIRIQYETGILQSFEYHVVNWAPRKLSRNLGSLSSSFSLMANILQNRTKYATLDFRAAAEYFIVSEYKFATLCSGCNTADMKITNQKWTRTAVIHNIIVLLLQMSYHTSANTKPSTISKIQVINYTWLLNVLTFLLVFNNQMTLVGIHTSIFPIHTWILHFSGQLF